MPEDFNTKTIKYLLLRHYNMQMMLKDSCPYVDRKNRLMVLIKPTRLHKTSLTSLKSLTITIKVN